MHRLRWTKWYQQSTKAKITVNRTIKSLKEKGVLKRTGADKNGSRIVKNKKGGEEMSRKFRESRKKNNLKLTVAAQMLGVSQPTLSSWESGRKTPTLENLEKMANLYHVTTDYLLGRVDNDVRSTDILMLNNRLQISNGKPVWSDKYGWLLINSSAQEFIAPNGDHIPFGEAGNVVERAPQYTESSIPRTGVLERSEILCQSQVWVEPISPDPDMREYLRGWYQVKEFFVENEFGIRFWLNGYGVKWFAFKSNQ